MLDEQENLILSEQIVQGELPQEPFYRAPGYALILASARSLGVSANGIFSAALAFGILLHAVNSGLIARISGKFFGHAAAYWGGLLAAFYPVLVHFSTQALDAVPSLTLFLAGLDRLIRYPGKPIRTIDWAATSFYWAAATLLRPNYLLVWLGLFVVVAFASSTAQRWRSVCAACVGGFLFLTLGLWQWSVSGVPGFLPWQGAYNLWAANQPSGHGRYYTQKTILTSALARQNPARIESILFYQKATNCTDADIPTMNAFWRAQFFEEIKSEPIKWVGLLVRKIYAFCNDWEQYNNKTYAFHRERSPWLFWNPLSFGIIVVLGTAGAFCLTRETLHNERTLLTIAAAYSASVILFYVSDRFRLPVAVLGIIFSAGVVSLPQRWLTWTSHRKSMFAIGVAGSASLTFSTFDQVRSKATFVQDHALLARASESVGDDQLAWNEARAALALQPQHPDAQHIAIVAYFNQLINETAPRANEEVWLRLSRQFLASPTPAGASTELRAIAALALWRSGEKEIALSEWRRLDESPSAIGARILAADASVNPADLDAFSNDHHLPPLAVIAAICTNRPWAKSTTGYFSNPTKLASQLFTSDKSP